jgi:hypothetical protein
MKSIIAVFLAIIIGCAGSKNVSTIHGDPLGEFYVEHEIILRKDSRIFVPDYVPGDYVISYYDLNKDGIVDYRKYSELQYVEWDLSEHERTTVWLSLWFRIDVDKDRDGEFDFWIERHDNGKLYTFDYDKPRIGCTVDKVINSSFNILFPLCGILIALNGTKRVQH